MDYFRGLAALGIVFYHYVSWTYGQLPADSVLGRIGLYGVAAFYVLSGLTLHHVYDQKLLPTRTAVLDFYLKRFFRLFPLLWMVMTVYVVLVPEFRNFKMILLNYTGLFGFFSWDKAIGTGVWSIGNELVFYALFPLFMFTAKNRSTLFAGLCILFVTIAFYLAFYRITPTIALDRQWHLYANPLNQVFLFLGGFLLVHLFKNKRVAPGIAALLACSSILIFSFFPSSKDSASLVTGLNRFVYSGCCLTACFAMYKLPLDLSVFLEKVLKILGDISYGLYLLHPLVYKIFKVTASAFGLAPGLMILLSTITSIAISYVVFKKFETPFILLGQRLSQRLAIKLTFRY